VFAESVPIREKSMFSRGLEVFVKNNQKNKNQLCTFIKPLFKASALF